MWRLRKRLDRRVAPAGASDTPTGAGADEPNVPLTDRLLRFELRLRDKGLNYMWALLFFFANVLIGISGSYHLLWKLEAVGSTDDTLKFWLAIGRFGGRIVTVDSALLILSGCLKSSTILRETLLAVYFPFDELMPHFHKYIAMTTAGAGILHTVALVIVYADKMVSWSDGLWSLDENGARTKQSLSTGIALVLMFASMIGIPFTRQKFFRIFWLHHLVMIIGIYTLLILHGCFFGKPYSYKYMGGPFLFWIFDKCWRTLGDNANVSYEGAIQIQGGGVVELRVPRPFKYRAGMYARICVKDIAKHEFHPFTIASSPEEPELKFYIKALGKWTKALHALAEANGSHTPTKVTVAVTGPLGAPAEHFAQFDHIVLVSGGIGATPMNSICADLMLKRKAYVFK